MQSNKLTRKICFVTSTAMTVNAFLQGPIKMLAENNAVYVVTNLLVGDSVPVLKDSQKVISIPLEREISPVKDLKALFALIRLFRKEKFDAVHSVTPKAGLLAMLAAFVARIPLRVHTFTGQVWASKKGIKRFLLKCIDILIAALTSHNLVDSPSQRDFLVSEKVISKSKAFVFEKGSISGVDLSKFKPDSEARLAIRKQLEIEDNKLVFLFIGRLNIDKGVLDLAQAFSQINNEKLHMLFVGPDEQNMQAEINNLQKNNNNIHFIGYTDMPEVFMAAADVLCLPSYREGFGSVLIEAAAVGLPVIASRIYGITDAVIDHETGLLHEPHDINAIQSLIERIAEDEALRTKLGQQARARAIRDFSSELITQAWVDFYQDKLGNA